jgi:hypothetical protein
VNLWFLPQTWTLLPPRIGLRPIVGATLSTWLLVAMSKVIRVAMAVTVARVVVAPSTTLLAAVPALPPHPAELRALLVTTFTPQVSQARWTEVRKKLPTGLNSTVALTRTE